MSSVDILLPTCNRLPSFIMALSGIAGQSLSNFRLIVSDQSEQPVSQNLVVQSLVRVIEARGGTVEMHHRTAMQGIAEQRDFLLHKSTGQYVLFVDDDVWMEPHVLDTLVATIEEQQCGFVGASPASLSHRDDFRPDEQQIEFWEGSVQPETITPGSVEWQRITLHQAANLHHVSLQIPPGERYLYKVAWVAACVLYDRQKLIEVGGFSFWDQLPHFIRDEDALVQNLILRRWGGCAIIPSGTYFSDIPSTNQNESGTTDGSALSLLETMIDEQALAAPEGQMA